MVAVAQMTRPYLAAVPAMARFGYAAPQSLPSINDTYAGPRRMSRPEQPARSWDSQTAPGQKHPLVDAWTIEDARNQANYSPLQIFALKSIAWYQKTTRFYAKDGEINNHYLFNLVTVKCPYNPSCSTYTAQAIREYGFWKGGWMGFVRIFHCNESYIKKHYHVTQLRPHCIYDPVDPLPAAA